MLKYILIIAVAFGAYKGFMESDGFGLLGNTITSDDYHFEVTFPSKPEMKTNTVNLPGYPEMKLTSYSTKEDNLFCMASASDFSNQTEEVGSLYDQIDSAERRLLNSFGGSIIGSDTIYKGSIEGYEINSQTKDEKLIKNQGFIKSKILYTLMCHYDDDEKNKSVVKDFMYSFQFI